MKTAVLLALLVAAVTCNDIRMGSMNGQFHYRFDTNASPFLWRRSDTLIIELGGEKIIRGIVVTDRRPEKDGEAKIIAGGLGQQKVIIEVKSPGIFRGYYFSIEVVGSLVSALDDFYM